MDIEDIDYINSFGHLPDDQESLIKYIEDNYKLDYEKIQKEEERINSIPWHTIKINIPVIPKGTPRPRTGKYGNFYVKGASKLKKRLDNWLTTSGLIITRTHYTGYMYFETPKSFSKVDMYLAEKKLIRPLVIPDWDNLGKTYTDVLQGKLLLNDNIICTGHIDKFYSIKPRVEIIIDYQEDFDCKYNRNKTINSKGFKEYMNKKI